MAASVDLLVLNVPQVFELLTERQLFDQDREKYSDDLHLQYITECLGPFPPEFLQACENQTKYFDENGKHTTSTTIALANIFA